MVDAGGGRSDEIWAAMVEQGWLGVALAEERGGLGFGTVELAVLLEEIGRHAAPVPFCIHGGGHRRGSTPRATATPSSGWWEATRWARSRGARAPTLSPRRRRATGGRCRVARIRCCTQRRPTLGSRAAVAPDGLALFCVDLDAAGRPAAEPAMDRTRELGWLQFDGTPAVRIGDADAVDALLDQGALFAAAEMLGGAGRVLDMAVEYAKDRVQFGRPIGSFQALKHRCADMLVDVEGMRSTVYWAAWCIGADDPEVSVAASTAKIWGSRRVEARDGVGAPGARRHRLHVGARPAFVSEARPARPAHVRRRRVSPRPPRRAAARPCGRRARASSSALTTKVRGVVARGRREGWSSSCVGVGGGRCVVGCGSAEPLGAWPARRRRSHGEGTRLRGAWFGVSPAALCFAA